MLYFRLYFQKDRAFKKNIKKLELELKLPLFIRKARGLELTEAGRVYKKYLLEINDKNEEFEQEIFGLNHKIVGQFILGAHPVLAKFILPKLKSSLTDFPSLKLNFDFSTSRECTEKVIQNEIDLAIVADPIDYPDLVKIKLWKEYIGLYSTDGLKKNELLYNNKMLSVQKLLKNYNSLKLQRIGYYDILYSILKRTNSMGFLPHPIAEKENKLKCIQKFKPGVEICLIYRVDKFQGKAFKTLSQLIKRLNYISKIKS